MPSLPYVLLAEDNEDDIELIQLAFQQLRIANPLIVVRDGQECLDYLNATGKHAERAADNLPQLLLLDINMPKLGGMQVLRRLRMEERTKLLPVVMLTTSEHEGDIRRCYELGANSYISKPVDYSEFRGVMREIGAYWLVLNTPPHPHQNK